MTSPPPRDREIEAAEARKRAHQELAIACGVLSIVCGVGAVVVLSTGADFNSWLVIAGAGAWFGLMGCLAATMARLRGRALVGLLACVAGLLACAVSLFIPFPLFVPLKGGRNEWSAIGDVRTVIAAEAAYENAAGQFGTLTCLATPSGCIAWYPANAPTFLDAALAQPSVTKDGYRRQWFEKPSRSASTPGAVDEFCYAATPEVPNKTGVRSFGGDSSGRIVATTAPLGIEILRQEWRGTAPSVVVCCNQSRLDTVACPASPD
jgi:hypothetical protein